MVTRPAETSVPTEDTAERPTHKKGATMKITVDEDKCCAAGSCVLAAPDVFDQRDEDGIVVLLDAEPAGVPVVVDVARRGPDEHQLADRLGRLRGREDADHGADRVTHEDRA